MTQPVQSDMLKNVFFNLDQYDSIGNDWLFWGSNISVLGTMNRGVVHAIHFAFMLL